MPSPDQVAELALACARDALARLVELIGADVPWADASDGRPETVLIELSRRAEASGGDRTFWEGDVALSLLMGARAQLAPFDIGGDDDPADSSIPVSEHAVLLHVSSLANADRGLDDVEDSLGVAIEQAGVGQLDGNEIGPDGAVVYMYGPDADALWNAIEPVARSVAIGSGSFVIRRYGGPGAAEVRTDL